ncbi:hypothetical protein RFI_11780 [Reticulomyxa filosa]|uniref:Uncharacterized protein n=1 Tax=Reticulomyxa filosa TaxID=46433 RepID=X6NJ37_RETFI|nr:hypothetical protein RFI_11780 [Reticulomyxa filosa]|eukprot:ETO25357.1 hypothetical protein RFI_11780 [Reticulomyxa filosa]
MYGLDKDPSYVKQNIELRRQLVKEIDQINETDWIGESAFVVMNTHKHREALKILEQIHKPTIRNQIYAKSWGDKETFWLSIVLSGKKPFFSSFGMQIVGIRVVYRQLPKKGILSLPWDKTPTRVRSPTTQAPTQRPMEICQRENVLVQYMSTGEWKGKEILYINGEGIERMLFAKPDGIRSLRAQYTYFSLPNVTVGHQFGFCRPLPQCQPFRDKRFDVIVHSLNRRVHLFRSLSNSTN